ncbi:MAG: hypothetical protein J0H63_10805 [Rhizobiales bacterium]|nr:hypothetical protein [Hyphomicrobiales bacterium]MBN9010591.1 hypothetical protein [Hyphomicrobiales bacterium]
MDGQQQFSENVDFRDNQGNWIATDVVVILIGSVLVVLGCFAPLVTMPVIGSIAYFGGGHGDGIFAIGLAVIAAILALAGRPRWAIVPGILELALITFTFLSLYSRLSDLAPQTAAQLEGNPFKEIAGAMVKTIGFSWGWVPLYIGALMTTFHAPLVRLISRH